jgi:uncharacterized cupin superfamily protein
MPRIDPAAAAVKRGSDYPAPFHEPCAGRTRHRLGDVAGLTQFGVNLMHLEPGAWSSQRHWHANEDEFVHVLQGEVVLVEDGGATVLRAGDSAGFKAGVPNGHHLVNRTAAPALLLEVGTRDPAETAVYADIDMRVGPDGVYTRKDGTPYPKRTA